MENNITLFGESEAPPKTQKTLKWLFVTNQRNLLYMLAAGLIMSPKGFGGKYYFDTLSSFPGWITLFADNVPQAAIDQSVSERHHLMPCIATIDLKTMHGGLVAIDINGRDRKIRFPDELNGSEVALLVPAPLPVTWLESIAFQSKDDKLGCEVDARDFGNIPLLDFKREIDARLFARTNKSPWPPAGVSLPDRDYVLDKSFAAGGIMAMLLHMGYLGDIAIQACRLGFDPGETETSGITDPMIRELGAWLETGTIRASTDVLPKLFWGAVDSVTTCRSLIDTISPIDVVLGYLEAAGNHLDERMNQALSKLANDLHKLTGLADSTVTELFERHPKPFSRVMTLFFLREKCSALIEFRHPLLTELDYVGAAILFAAREGWLGLPLALRDIDGLQAAVSHRMAAMAHRKAGSEIDLGEPPTRPMPLRELFVPGTKGWTTKQTDAALLLARDSKWVECIHTRINLGKGKYHMIIDGSGVQIMLSGDVKAVTTEVNAEQFFSLFGGTTISLKSEKKIRDLLKA
jgi:hypothetical protein